MIGISARVTAVTCSSRGGGIGGPLPPPQRLQPQQLLPPLPDDELCLRPNATERMPLVSCLR